MGKKCFIVGCTTGYYPGGTKQRHKSLFKARCPEQLENWRKLIPRADKQISMKDSVCENHFTEDDIIWYFETKLPDGTIYKLRRENPVLKKTAIPTRFPQLPEYSRNISKLVEKMKSKTNQNAVTSKNSIPAIKITDKYQYFDHTEVSMNEISDEISNLNENVGNCEYEVFTFSMLIENLETISKPSILWGVTKHDAFIMCAKWSEMAELEKRVIIDCNLNAKVFLKDEEDSSEYVIKSFEEVSSILEYVHLL